MDNILFFIEEIMIKYGLEKELIDNDANLKDMLSRSKDIRDRVFFKFLYSEKIYNYEKNGIPLDIPSIKLKKIIEDLIDKKISLNNLPKLIQDNLNISPEISKKITEEIEKNKEITDEMSTIKADKEEDDITEETIEEETKKTKSIGYELLK